MNNKYLEISALTKYIKYKFDNDEHLRKVYLKGEISNLKIHSTGHLYLSLKDEYSNPFIIDKYQILKKEFRVIKRKSSELNKTINML